MFNGVKNSLLQIKESCYTPVFARNLVVENKDMRLRAVGLTVS